jgi:hypothetical protein
VRIINILTTRPDFPFVCSSSSSNTTLRLEQYMPLLHCWQRQLWGQRSSLVVAAGVVPDVQVMHTACVPMMPLLHALRRGVSGAIIKNASLACVVCADRFYGSAAMHHN